MGAATVSGQKIGRNDPCSCGSKRYKVCRGLLLPNRSSPVMKLSTIATSHLSTSTGLSYQSDA